MNRNAFLLWSILLLFFTSQLTAQLVEPQELWSSYFDYQELYDLVYDMTIDPSGNIYVTGENLGFGTTTIKFSPTGNQLWASSYEHMNPRSIEVDASGNVYITGRILVVDGNMVINRNVITIKYNSSGTTEWVSTYDGGGISDEYGNDIEVDASGNVFVAGEANVSGFSNDFLVIKYNSSGVQQWATTYDGPGPDSWSDIAYALKLDGAGNILATGETSGLNGFSDGLTMKLNPSGTILWLSFYVSPNNFDDILTELVIDESGYVYAGGTSDGPSSADTNKFLIIKYDPATGEEMWVAAYNGGLSAELRNLLLDGSGNLIAAGGGYFDPFNYGIVKYNSSGELQWVTGGLEYLYYPTFTLDSEDNVYVTDQIFNDKNDVDLFTARFNESGLQVWSTSYNLPNNVTLSFVGVDGSDNVIVATSGFNTDETRYDYLIKKYEQVHLPVDDAITEVSSDVSSLPLSNGNKNALNAKLQNAISKYNSGDLNAAKNILLAFLNQLSQFIADGDITQEEAQPIINYVNLILGEIEDQLAKISIAVIPGDFSLSQNYPNPFNPSTKIKFDVPAAVNVEISVFNSLGEKVADLVDEVKEAGQYEFSWNATHLPSGIYFYKMKAGEFVSTKKMILMR
jgi:hypothetical protein